MNEWMNEQGENGMENGFFGGEKSRLRIPSKDRGPGNKGDWAAWKPFFQRWPIDGTARGG